MSLIGQIAEQPELHIRLARTNPKFAIFNIDIESAEWNHLIIYDNSRFVKMVCILTFFQSQVVQE